MKYFILTLSILFTSLSNFGNGVEGFPDSIKNVHILSGFEWYDDNYKPSWSIYNSSKNCDKIQKAFLKKLVDNLDLDDYPFQINIWVDCAPFELPHDKKRDQNGFSSIGYSDSNNNPTLEIIFQHPRRKDTSYQYSRIYTLVKYAVENIDLVKQRQKKMTFNNFEDRQGNARYISVALLDTSLIKSIPTEQFNFNPEKALKKRNIALPISLFAAFMGIFIAISASRNAAKKNAKT